MSFKGWGEKIILIFTLLYIIFQGFLFRIPCFLSVFPPTEDILFYCDMNVVKNNMSFDRIPNIFLSLITHKTEFLWRTETGLFIFSSCLHIKALLTEFVFFLIQMFVSSSLLSESVQWCSVNCNEGIAKLNKSLRHKYKSNDVKIHCTSCSIWVNMS